MSDIQPTVITRTPPAATVMTPNNISADDTVLHDTIAAVSSLCPTAQYSVDYTVQVTAGVATFGTWNSALGAQPTPDQIQTALTNIKLSAYKVAQTSAVQAAYQNATYNTPISYMNTTFWTDQASRDLLLGSENGYTRKGATPAGFAWWDATGAAVPMALSDLQGLYDAILDMSEANFVQRKTLLASITAATTVAAVQAVTW